jgi:hypothetical protein
VDQIRLLKNGSDAVKERAAAVALRNLAANHTNNQAMIGDSNGIPPLLNLLQTGTTDDQKIRAA